MCWKMKKDTYANVIFCLIYREPIKLHHFEQRFGCRNIFYKARRKISDFFTGFPKKHKIYREMTKDPYIMKAVLEQNMPDIGYGKIVIEREITKVYIYWLHLVEVKNEMEYDTFWADVFTRLILSKFVNYVELSISGDENSDITVLKEKINNWISTIQPIIPEEGWKAAIENGQTVYGKHPSHTRDNRVIVTFFASWPGRYEDHGLYWGYLKQ